MGWDHALDVKACFDLDFGGNYEMEMEWAMKWRECNQELDLFDLDMEGD